MSIPAIILPNVAFVAIRAYAAYSYLYYDKDESLVSDGDFDMLCKWMLENYDALKPHDINGYLKRGMLQAGTGFHLAMGKVCGMTKKWADEQLEIANRRKPKRKAKARPKPQPLADDDDLSIFD